MFDLSLWVCSVTFNADGETLNIPTHEVCRTSRMYVVLQFCLYVLVAKEVLLLGTGLIWYRIPRCIPLDTLYPHHTGVHHWDEKKNCQDNNTVYH